MPHRFSPFIQPARQHAKISVERSDYYAPNHLLVYLRHPMGGRGAQQVRLPPELFEPTSQF